LLKADCPILFYFLKNDYFTPQRYDFFFIQTLKNTILTIPKTAIRHKNTAVYHKTPLFDALLLQNSPQPLTFVVSNNDYF
jgi:hypothetical protein